MRGRRLRRYSYGKLTWHEMGKTKATQRSYVRRRKVCSKEWYLALNMYTRRDQNRQVISHVITTLTRRSIIINARIIVYQNRPAQFSPCKQISSSKRKSHIRKVGSEKSSDHSRACRLPVPIAPPCERAHGFCVFLSSMASTRWRQKLARWY
jgi:hypothetical protein